MRCEHCGQEIKELQQAFDETCRTCVYAMKDFNSHPECRACIMEGNQYKPYPKWRSAT